MTEDDWGCLGGVVVAAIAGWWLYNHYEIKKREPAPTYSISSTPSPRPRPTGWIQVSESENGSVWRVNADSIKGPRNARTGWIMIDDTKAKKRTDEWRTVKQLEQIDCTSGGARQLSFFGYDQAGKVTYSSDIEPSKAKVDYSPPDSIGFSYRDFMCGSVFDDVIASDIPPKTKEMPTGG